MLRVDVDVVDGKGREGRKDWGDVRHSVCRSQRMANVTIVAKAMAPKGGKVSRVGWWLRGEGRKTTTVSDG